MWIKREIEHHLGVISQESAVVAVTGARQVGKTSLLQTAFPDFPYISLDLPRLAEEAEESGESFLASHPHPLLIDEVQYAPKLFRYLKAYVDRHKGEPRPLFLLTGSQKFPLMEKLSESLSGRIRIIELLTLSHRELEEAFHLKSEKNQLLEWIHRGGYPQLYSENLNYERFYQNYVVTYLERDVRQILGVRNLGDFEKFLRLLSLRSGQLLSLQNIANETGVKQPTVKSWLEVLAASQIVGFLQPYFSNPGKRLVKTPKVYFLDTGLCCYLAGIRRPTDLEQSPLLGAIFETHVYGQIMRAYANRGLQPEMYFFRDHDGNEIDFVLFGTKSKHLLEVKWQETPTFPRDTFTFFQSKYGKKVTFTASVVSRVRGRRALSPMEFVRDSIDWQDLF